MKNLKLRANFIVLCALSSMAQTSMAQTSMTTTAAENQSYFYVGGGAGYGRMNGEDFTNNNNDLTKNKVSWKALVGMKMNNMLSVEGQYIDFGAANRDNDRIQATGWTAGVVLDFVQDSSITPYGKIGALMWEADNRFNGISLSDNGTDVTAGLGVRFAVSDRVAIKTEYERFMLDNTDIDSLSATIQYNFF